VSDLARALLDELAGDPVALERLRALVGETVVMTTISPWLTAAQAAAHLACPESRIRKLTMTGELPCHRDGRRVLYRREELDAYVLAGGAVSP
jgi:excisionase family DNA binding protein